jgi:CRISPR system Cascade subunit CasE
MFLSKLTLDPRHPQARPDLADAYEMHRTLARAFVPDAETAPTRFLWRLERRADYQPSSVVLVQSAQPADWSVLDAFPGYVAEIHGNKAVDL